MSAAPPSWIVVLAAVVAVGLGVFVLSRNPRSTINRAGFGLFALLAASHGGWLLIPWPEGVSAWLLAEGWLPGALFFFCRRLGHGPGGGTAVFRWAGRLAVAFGACASAAAALPAWVLRIDMGGNLPLSVPATWGISALLLLYVVALLNLENLYRATEGELRWRVKYLLLGLMTLIAIRLYVLTLSSLYGMVPAGAGAELALGTLAGGMMAAYALVRHRLLDVDVFVSRYVIYHSITLAAVGTYLLVVGLAVLGLRQLGDRMPVVLVTTVVFLALTALSVALLSDTLRWRLRHFVDSHFYRNRHDYRAAWRQTTRAVAAERTLAGHVIALSRMVKAALGAHFVVTLLAEGRSGRCVAPPDGRDGTDISPLVETELVPDPSPAWGGGAGRVPVHRHAGRHDRALFLPIEVGAKRIGWLALGPRVAATPYHLEDLELARDMAAQTAVAVRNLQLAEELAESREQTALHQISTFFIHDMKNTANSLGMLARNIRKNQDNPAFWADAEAGITRAVEQMNALMARLRELRAQAPPRAMRIPLGTLLERWSGKWRRAVSAAVDLELEGPLPCLGDSVLLESVFTNLVLNAAEAGAGHIRIEAAHADGVVRARVTDDGCGMDAAFVTQELFKPFTSTKPLGMGIGLFQSRRAVEQLGGALTVTSTKGRGSCFTITLPVAPDGPDLPADG
ncbi:MAG: hypothetical protein HZA24_08190 [Nitrospirae bacterium]|nr:hypothetical protein [Nitrospirota bacterium]